MKGQKRIPLQITIGWHFAAASLFIFLSTLLATMGMRGYNPAVSFTLSAVFLGATILGASAGYGLSQNIAWAARASHAFTAFVGIGSLALITSPIYAAEIAPQACVPFVSVIGLTAMAFLVSGHLFVSSRPKEAQQ